MKAYEVVIIGSGFSGICSAIKLLENRHTSVIYFIESQLRYIMDAIKKSKKNKWKSIEIKPAVEKRFNQNLQKALKGTIWQKGACSSWYLTEAGKNTSMYPNFSFIFRHNTRRFDKQKHLTIPAQKL